MFFGVDNTFLSRALDAGIFAESAPPRAGRRARRSSSSTRSHRLTPIDHGDVCINYDKQWFAKQKLAVPTSLDDLTKPAYKGLLVVENPATSSPGLAFLLATIAKLRRRRLARLLGEAARQRREGRRRLGERVRRRLHAGRQPGHLSARGLVRVEPARRGRTTRSRSRRRRPIGTMLDSCFRQVEFAGVLKGTDARAAARQARRLHAVAAVPGRHAAPDVRVPGARRHAAARRCSASSPRCAATRCRSRPPTSAHTATQWIEQWTDTVLR